MTCVLKDIIRKQDYGNGPLMDTRISPTALSRLAIQRKQDATPVAGDTVPRPEVEGHLPGKGSVCGGRARTVHIIHKKARRRHKRRQRYRRSLPEDTGVAEMDRTEGIGQCHLIYCPRDGADSRLLRKAPDRRQSRTRKRPQLGTLPGT